MAEANVMEVEMVDFQSGQIKYFCHQCSLEIDPKLPGLTCPLCNSDFIEELSDNLQRDRETTSTAPPNVTDQILMDLLTSQPTRSRYDDDDEDNDDGEVWSRSRNSISSLSSSSRRRSQRGSERGLPLHSFIESVLDSLRDDSYRRFGTDFTEPRLRRYGREFRRNYGGLEDLFTQILTQLTASGPEPASQSQIDELPTMAVKQEHLDNSTQCSICLENFVLNEEVTSLPCNHLHHRYCIVPWLQLHATCPVCRHILSPSSPPDHPAIGSPFHFTDRSHLSLEPEDRSVFRTTMEEPDSMSINLSVHPFWESVILPGGLDDSAESGELAENAASSPHGGRLSAAPNLSDIEMENMNNNVAMDVAFDDDDVGAVGGLENDEEGPTSSELPGRPPASMLTYIKDIEVSGLDSELESDL